MEAEHDKGSYEFEKVRARDAFRDKARQQRLHRKRERWEHHMDKRIRNCHHMKHSRKGWLGVGIILVGILWLANVMGAPLPDWLFSWPMLLVAIGLFSGLASGFRNMGSVVMIFIGLVFIARNHFLPDVALDRYLWPVILIFVGVLFLVKRHSWEEHRDWGRQRMEDKLRDIVKERRKWPQSSWEGPHGFGSREEVPPSEEAVTPPKEAAYAEARPEPPAPPANGPHQEKWSHAEDWLDVTTVFGGAKRHVISKNFKGGDLTNLCGGTVIDLTHADIQGTVVIDLVAIWGGIKLAVPPNWQVRMNLTHLMAGTDDRRMNKAPVADPNKILVITGTVLMAGIEISDHA